MSRVSCLWVCGISVIPVLEFIRIEAKTEQLMGLIGIISRWILTGCEAMYITTA